MFQFRFWTMAAVLLFSGERIFADGMIIESKAHRGGFKAKLYTIGDFTGDGVVDGRDLAFCRSLIMGETLAPGLETLALERRERLDLDGDGRVDVNDLLALERMVNAGKSLGRRLSSKEIPALLTGSNAVDPKGCPTSNPVLDARFFNDYLSLRDTGGVNGKVINVSKLPPHKKNFCSRSEADIAGALRSNPGAHSFGFKNPPGWADTGLCWMHSRFQRNASYLANFRPKQPKPSAEKIEEIVATLAGGGEVVDIPGYANFNEFSKKNESMITQYLNYMGNRCVITMDCARRIGDVSSEGADALRSRMDALQARMTAQPDLVYLRTHAADQGILTSHAWLLTGMQPIYTDIPLGGSTTVVGPADRPPVGYRMLIVDSNFPNRVGEVIYKFGDTSIKPPFGMGKEGLLPYPDYNDDLNDNKQAILKYCRGGS